MTNTPEGGERTERERPSAEEMVARLSSYLNDYSDEIPTERILGQRTHKVNTAWFQGAFSNMRFVLNVFLKNQDLAQEVEAFFKTFSARRHEGLEAMRRGEQPDSFVPTTREEINQMNALLRKVIENLQNSI